VSTLYGREGGEGRARTAHALRLSDESSSRYEPPAAVGAAVPPSLSLLLPLPMSLLYTPSVDNAVPPEAPGRSLLGVPWRREARAR